MQQYPSYEEYKKTDLEWLGEIPKHWEVKRIKYVFKEINERSNNGLEDLLSVSQYTGVTLRKEKVADTEMLFTNAISLVGYKMVKKNDLVINIMLAWNGSLGISNYDGIVSPAYGIYRLKNKNFDTRYFDYLFRTKLYKSEFRKKSTGVIESRLRLYTDSFFRINAILPPISEQKSIAQFLDHKTQQIQQFISKKQQHVQLLQEHKAAIINKAVTKGIDSNVALKDSGIDWLGKIPTHWEVSKLKWLVRTESGATPNSGNISEYYDGKFHWVRTLDLNNEDLYDTEIKITAKAIRETNCKLIPKNSILVAMYGGSGTIGKNALLKVSATTNQAVCSIFPSKYFNPKYLHFYIKFYRPLWMKDALGSRVDPNINQSVIRNLVIPLLSIEEQQAIVTYIQNVTSKIDQSTTKIEQQIQLIEEYQQSLIAQAVTGKIDIRGIAN